MPVPISYPGVYIEEVPSGVRTITGVATSVAAFVGRAKRGPIDEAKVITSYADYERSFGGLDLSSAMSFSVRDFYRNGGTLAVIVRLFNAGNGTAVATLSADNLELLAISSGAWGNRLRVTVSYDDAATADVAAQQGLSVTDLFNLTVEDLSTGFREDFLNVSVAVGPRQLDRVLENMSTLVRLPALPDPLSRPAEGVYTVLEADEASDGNVLGVNDYIGTGKDVAKEGLYALEQADMFNLLCLPPDWDTVANASYPGALLSTAASYCEDKRRAMLLVDPPSDWGTTDAAVTGISTGIGTNSKNAAIFFPRIKQTNPLRDNQLESFVPCGAVAGIFARTDSQRGVWKAPAGMEATMRGVTELTVKLTDQENGRLNPLGVNCLRAFPIIGRTIWGSRTLKGADQLASEWKYIPVRRTALFIEESLYRGTQWVVFEPNDEPLWSQIRLNVGAFMHNLFRQGAFQGTTPREAYFVKCDKETTTQNDIDRGIVNVVVGFAPLKPAEFVIVKLQQIAGELEV
ncbi:MAG: phage tail sheath subtilisin-like domain-containing protein [Gammaproteobacteria bacterium]|nr:phage tail sheath subtilisin-like domain-containing protein [Gammaproteobacteria bacterium]